MCTKPQAACTASVCRWRMRCRNAWRSRSRANRRSTAWHSSAASRRASWRRPGARRTGAAPRCASVPIRRFSARARISVPSASSKWRARRPTSTAASRSAGRARRNCCAATTCPRRRRSTSRRASRIISVRSLTARRWCIPTSSPAAPARPASMAAPNGRSPGLPTWMAFSHPIATPSRRRTAAPMNWDCAAPSPKASRITPSAWARASARHRSPRTTS